MKVKFFIWKIENDKGNPIHLFSHKVSQFIKHNLGGSFGVFSNESDNFIEIRIKKTEGKEKLSQFLNKKIIESEVVLELNDGDSIVVQMAFKSNHIKNVSKKEQVDESDIDCLGYFPNHKIVNNKFLNYLNRKEILNIDFEGFQENKPNKVKMNYLHDNKPRKMSVKTQSFVFLDIKIHNEIALESALIEGIGVKKSYGFSKIDKI